MTDAAALSKMNRAPNSETGAAPGLFAVTVFTSAALVFMVEPMVAKLVLPTLGGSPAVWNTSMAFFQGALLVGYAYAHVLQRFGSVRTQTLIHGAVLIAAALVLPLKITGVFGDPDSAHPALWLLGVLALSIGAPFAALSATAPLVQAWYARVRAGKADAENPYVLYAASNLGSLLALLAYPVIVEPLLRLRVQTTSWSLGYGLFVVLMGAVALLARRSAGSGTAPHHVAEASSEPTAWTTRLIWVGLAAAPASLMLGVTTYISTDIASAPFLWVAPLALYLLTFVIAFQARPMIGRELALTLQAAAYAACILTFSLPVKWFLIQVLLHLVGFFLTALVCHQALAARRPAPSKLTEFYLLMSLGGVLGGAFNAFLAPVIFKSVLEYPIVLLATALARPWGKGWLTRGQTILFAAGLVGAAATVTLAKILGPRASLDMLHLIKLLLAVTLISAFMLRDRAWFFLALCLVMVGASQLVSPQEILLKTDRDFFGVLRMTRMYVPGHGEGRRLAHGTTLHGAQLLNPTDRCRPLVYYAPTTPIGQVFRAEMARKPVLKVAAIGMGAGTVAAYTRPGDSLRFFEIDPADVAMATDPANFTYINGCAKGHIDTVLGDARLTLSREPANTYDLILVDAFSSDSVPAHLLTVEAMRGYLMRLKPDGVVIMHLSNRNLELMQPVSGIARAAGGFALQQAYRKPPDGLEPIDTDEDAVIVGRDKAALAPFTSQPQWRPADPGRVRVWTDDYTNLFGALIRGVGHNEREAAAQRQSEARARAAQPGN
jgi:SAM-dependent methyltransferase